MSEREFNAIFSERLRYYLNKYEITQLELSKRLGVGTTSVYNWCNGIKTPRMDKVDAMCEIFHCKRSDLMEDKSYEPQTITSPKIVDYYNQLNDFGKHEAEKRVEELTFLPRYTNPSSNYEINAAHAIENASDDDKAFDEDIMDDENF